MIRTGMAKLVMCAALGSGLGGAPRASIHTPLAQPDLKPAPPTPIAETKEELGKPGWDPDWDMIVEKALPPAMLGDQVTKAVKPFCPRFRAMTVSDRRAFWAYFFQALAGAEAALVPTTNVQHVEPEVAVEDMVTLRLVRAEGLLQLTYMDARRYGCDFDWTRDRNLPEYDPSKTILQPENNLLCGVKILSNQIINQHRPLLDKNSYWSTLHPHTFSNKVFLKQMTNVPDVCRDELFPQEAQSTAHEAEQPRESAGKGSGGAR